MEQEFKNYLERIGFTPTLVTRVEQIYKYFITELYPNMVIDIFVEDYYNSENSRDYESLFFFLENGIIFEVKNFRVEENFLFFNISNHIINIATKMNDYHLKEDNYGNESKFLVNFNTDQHVYVELKSARNNCEQLKKVLQNYLIPNMKK